MVLLAVLFFCNMPRAAAQEECYTLTNGRLYWYEHDTWVVNGGHPQYQTDVAFDHVTSTDAWNEVHPYSSTHVTHITEAGTIYARLDLTDPDNPVVSSTTTFDEYCVWHRSGNTGYYYQEHGGFYYYLMGTNAGLTVAKVQPGTATDKLSLWFNWDFGAAVKEVTYVDGARRENYYWMMYDRNNIWTMSCNSYQRPEDVIYDDYDWTGTSEAEAINLAKKRYYCNIEVDGNNFASGNGALVMPTMVTHHPKALHGVPANYGFQSLSVRDASNNEITEMAFQDMGTITPVVTEAHSVTSDIQVTPEYWEYREETYRYGINLNYRERTEDIYGSSGVPTYRYYYYYGGTMHSDGSFSQAAAPAPTSSDLVVSRVTYSLNPSAYRYMRFNDIETPGSLTLTSVTTPVTLTCFQVPPRGSKTKLTVRVEYTNGAVQERTVTIDMDNAYTPAPMPEAENAPVVHGSVFGGGRMANVAGNTNVTVHNCDSIYALYGGNDIAGWVQGEGGATITIGTERTNSTAPVKIGWVYGGGCGYYSYRGITFSATHGYPYRPGTDRYGLAYQNYYFGNGTHEGSVYPWGTVPTWAAGIDHDADYEVTAADTADLEWPATPIASGFKFTPVSADPEHVDASETGEGGNGTIPYVKTAHIIVGVPGDGQESHNDYILIDSLFGGAENAFIGVTSSEENPANAISIDINGGSIFALFGGNNYGGSVANTATVLLTVNNTKLPPVLTGAGAGNSLVTGNPILEPISNVSFFNGIGRTYGIRTLFGGGNMVDGSHAMVTINGGVIDTAFAGGNSATVNLPTVRVNCVGDKFICDNPSYNTSAPNFGPDNLVTEVGNYNIHTLFGGNNKAASNTLSLVQLLSGGISTVYGGGNAGDMNNEALISRPELRLLMDQTLTVTQLPRPVAVGSIVYTPQTSKIICDYVYGGCRMANVKHSSGVVLYGGMFGYVYGGNDISGDVGSTIPTTVINGQGYRDGAYAYVMGNTVVVGDATGGSDGYYHCDSAGAYYKNDDIYDQYSGMNYDPYHEFVGLPTPTHNNTFMAVHGNAHVYGNVVTGGLHTNVGFDDQVHYEVTPEDGVRNGTTHLSVLGGTVDRNVFGGGYLSSIYGLTYLHVGGTATINGSLFGGNDLLGAVESYGAYTFSGVQQDSEYAAAESSNGNKLNVFDGSQYNAAYSCYLKIDGTPHIRSVYGGGNGAYNYDGQRPEYGAIPSLCPNMVGGINRPLQSSTFIDINVEGGLIDTVFGGGNGTSVRDNVVVLLNSQNNDGRYVNIIFGGNNQDEMTTCVPDILLEKGRVGDVYGGGNSGSMLGSAEFTDICGRPVTGISTYVKVDHAQALVEGSIYGGCRMADVTGMAYVDIRNGEVHNVYGGNDISGTVSGNTRVDVSGGTVHNIFGGSNGKYDYDFISSGSGDELSLYYNIYTFGSEHTDANLVAQNHTGRPYVDSTTVNLYGGTMTTDVYGGGNLGDCRLTLVEVDDRVCTPAGGPLSLSINGSVYGGGKGLDDNLNGERHGNVMTLEDDDNLPARTHVNLRHATHIENTEGKVKAYGGGRGGDVKDTYITAFSTWGTPFDELYGGCWGSDVIGTTHVVLEGSTTDPSAMTAENVYGGNDFTGSVYSTDITINSGRYGNIFGGGNGDYEASNYTSGAYAGNFTADDQRWNAALVVGQPRRIYEPNNEYAVINFNDGIVMNNVYGGGRQGTTMRYERDAQGVWKTVAGGAAKVADTLRSLTTPAALPYTDQNKYSRIIVNVANGTFEHNIYAGGMGKDGGGRIVYGLKELNIVDGLVKESIYGGSENVNDGYGNECVNETNTTMRPSSILNVTGGTIKNNVYGGGYLGNVNGSVYVNIGIEAVENCVLWTKAINGQDSAYMLLKPGGYIVNGPGDTTWGYTPAMTTNPLQLQASVYGGANWGNNVGSADFSKQGFYGGESRILVDGEGYNSYNDAAHEHLPLINIVHSLIGAGTSAEGGDVYNRIDLRNYGAINPATCRATRSLKAIQCADGVWLENTAVDYTGATDAISAYLSQQYTINRVDTLNCVGYNVVEIEATMTNIGTVNYLYTKEHSDQLLAANSSSTPAVTRTVGWFEPSLTYMYVPNALMPQGDACATSTMCDRLELLDREVPEKQITALVINNGINVDIIKDGQYGNILGFGLLVAQNGTNAVVTAAPKYGSVNANNGGFTTTCKDEMQAISGTGGTYGEDLTWCDCWDEGTAVNPGDCNNTGSWLQSKAEYPYSNYSTSYRVWKIGEGKRRRYAVIQAHSIPDSIYTLIDPTGLNVPSNRNYGDKRITLRYTATGIDSIYNLALAKAKLVLPPTTPGHYYKINGSTGVVIDDENQEMRLTDMSYNPEWDQLDNNWKLTGSTTARPATGSDAAGTNYEADEHGAWHNLTLEGDGTLMGVNNIYNYPGGKQYFGLMLKSGENFSSELPSDEHGNPYSGNTTIAGNSYTNMISNFATAKVGASVNTSPELDLYLLYDNRFSHTMVGTVKFTLDEYDEHGVIIPNSEIEVEITISTILQDFATMEYEVLAMYNEGRSDRFARKVVLPATLQQRELYLEGVSWFPTDVVNEGGSLKANGDTLRTANESSTDAAPQRFFLTDDRTAIKNQSNGEHSYFGMTVQPVENVSNTLVTAVSWHSISQLEPLDLFTTVYGTGNTQPPTRAYNDSYYQESGANPAHKIDSADLRSAGLNPYGIKLGNLDGRGEAALNVVLSYDGSRVYDGFLGKGYVGKVVLNMVSYTGGDYDHGNRFKVIINVKTRDHSDTIYLASKNYFDQNENTEHTIAGTSYKAKKCTNWTDPDAGKDPHHCATSFYDALTKVYQEGDVIAILGEVIIDGHEQTLIKGNEYMPIPVIRYEGHHNLMPGEKCVYRGPMVTVDGADASFTARCIEFKGSMISKIEPSSTERQSLDGNRIIPTTEWENAHPLAYNPVNANDYKYVDTNMAFGPILRAINGGTLTLQHGVIVEHNNNGYWTPDYQAAHSTDTFNSSLMGAISVTKGGTLNLVNNVNIKHNISNATSASPNWNIKPESGAVYVDGGTMYLMASNAVTAIHIDTNYLADNTQYWKNHTINVEGVDKLIHYDFNDDTTNGYFPTVTSHELANVYLQRTEKTLPSELASASADVQQAWLDMNDDKTDRIEFDDIIAAGTRIGITKWFPDAAQVLRDTIQVAYQADATYMLDAENNGNFVADNRNYFTFYNYGVNNQRMYLARCATFKFQLQNTTDEYITGSGVYTYDALSYHPLSGASCPVGGDSLIVRAQGGFFPYTYTWTNPGADFTDDSDDETIRQRRTPNTNNEVNKQMQLATPNYAPLALAMADTLLSANVDMPYNETERTVRYVVTVDDVTGHCRLTKKAEVKLVKQSDPSAEPFVKTGIETVWTAQDAPNTVNADSASGTRNYRAVRITPMVWSPGSGALAVTSTSGDPNIYIINGDDSQSQLESLHFCEGDVLRLSATPKWHLVNKVDEYGNQVFEDDGVTPVKERTYDSKFVMWDFDPYYSNPTGYVVPPKDQTVVAYFAPMDYWKDTVTSTTLAKAVYDANFTYTSRAAAGNAAAGMVTTYNGDVHIYNEDGLAWLISCINGFNGTQARTFHFNRVYVHYKDGGYDMKKYLWTPMGTLQHPFEGMLIGVGESGYNADNLTTPWSAISGTDTTWTAPVVIKNIIVDEPHAQNAGFFAVIDSARIVNIELQGAMVRGSQNVGTLAGKSSNSNLRRVNVTSAGLTSGGDDNYGDVTTTILSTHYLSGGVLGLSNLDTIKGGTIAAKFVGDAVYSGGVVGYGTSTKAVNNSGYNDNRMRGLYVGGMAGYLNGTAPMPSGLFRAKREGKPSIVQNNYFRVTTTGKSQRVGGVAGYAENAILENNYIYGDMESSAAKGGVVATANDGTRADHNYYENGTANQGAASVRGTATVEDYSAFEGQGNSVTLHETMYGVSNLTRVLNKWVREQGSSEYRTWRSDLTGDNNGYPVFGTPDMIPVEATLDIEGCEEVELDGVTYTADATITTNVIDNTEMIDSTTTIHIRIHHGTVTNLTDSALVEEGYEGFGFTVTPTEAMLLNSTILEHGSAQMVLSDTLSTVFGCDSVVTLTLTFTGGLDIPEVEVTTTATVKVYPNPTVDVVNIEADGLQHVELYDNEGRTMADYDAPNGERLRINVSHLATGIYYLRVHTPTAVTIQKIVKR